MIKIARKVYDQEVKRRENKVKDLKTKLNELLNKNNKVWYYKFDLKID